MFGAGNINLQVLQLATGRFLPGESRIFRKRLNLRIN